MATVTIDRKSIGWVFWIQWVIVITALGVLGLIIYQAVGQVLADTIWELVVDLLLTALLGTFQWLLLRRWLSRLGWWILATVIGGIAGSYVYVATFNYLGSLGTWGLSVLLVTAATARGAVVGVTQSVILWKRVSGAGWWVIISIVDSVLMQSTSEAIGLSLGIWGTQIVTGLIQGIITGTTLVWLLKKPAAQAPSRPVSRITLGVVGALAGTFAGVALTLLAYSGPEPTDILQAYLFPCLAVLPSSIGGFLGGIGGGLIELRLRSDSGFLGAIIGGTVAGVISTLVFRL